MAFWRLFTNDEKQKYSKRIDFPSTNNKLESHILELENFGLAHFKLLTRELWYAWVNVAAIQLIHCLKTGKRELWVVETIANISLSTTFTTAAAKQQYRNVGWNWLFSTIILVCFL